MTSDSVMDVPNLHNIYSKLDTHLGTIDEIMKVLHIVKKGKMMDTLEKFVIYKETKLWNQINDKTQ